MGKQNYSRLQGSLNALRKEHNQTKHAVRNLEDEISKLKEAKEKAEAIPTIENSVGVTRLFSRQGWTLILVTAFTSIVIYNLHRYLESKGFSEVWLWVSLTVGTTLFLQWLCTSAMYNNYKTPWWNLGIIVLMGPVSGFVPMLSASVVLKNYLNPTSDMVYVIAFFFQIVLMSVYPIYFFRRKANKDQGEAKDAYEVIKPFINSYSLLATIFIFINRYFLGGSTGPISMPGIISDFNTAPFYFYPWTFAITFAEYFIKRKKVG